MNADAPRGKLVNAEEQSSRLLNIPSSPQLIRNGKVESNFLIGCGGHARSIIDIIEVEKKWSICGLVGKMKN